ncbi:MAG: glycosyltransferase family 39 protein [Planctomycetes bacterium]|nr:glycosyltransferase family 39 protein [Planctomycetota bacterium]
MTTTHSHQRTVLLGLVLLSLGARFAMLKDNLWRLGEEVDGYLKLAESLSDWGTFGSKDVPTAYRPPLYPLLLAPAYWLQRTLVLAWGWRLTAIAFLHLCLGAGTAVLTWRAAKKLDVQRWSVLAGVLVAIDPLLLHHSRLAMTETLAAFLFAASLNLLLAADSRPRALHTLVAGFVLGLGMLCRTTFWSFTVLTVFAVVLFQRTARSVRVKWVGLLLAAALVVQIPWAARNWIALGRPVLTTTHGGYTLLLGNNDVFYDEVIGTSWSRVWPGESLSDWQEQVHRESGAASELEYDSFCYRLAWNTIRSRPRDFLLSIGYRIVSFWRLTPRETEYYPWWVRLGCALFYVPELLLMIIGLAGRRARQWPGVLLPTALLSFTLVHAVYWSDMRMRAPIMPAVAILAVMGMEQVTAWFNRQPYQQEPVGFGP